MTPEGRAWLSGYNAAVDDLQTLLADVDRGIFTYEELHDKFAEADEYDVPFEYDMEDDEEKEDDQPENE